jgi:succinate dehydrogenase (ubiquinone) cytochrome b560 subunit|tara:strand:+ start:78 stop:767 length:690 start_codon:yes stop_codon:yes gene_type:complete
MLRRAGTRALQQEQQFGNSYSPPLCFFLQTSRREREQQKQFQHHHHHHHQQNLYYTKKSFTTSATSKIGQTGVPEEYGQPKTGGTAFLGTPRNHRELLNKRPLSPDVLDVDGKSAHYKFPIVALSSITNRVTGCVLSGAVGVGGVIACVGGPEAVPETVELFKSQFPLLVFPAKAMLSFPFVYHGVAGLRHVIWDMSVFGIDNENAKKSSMFVFASSIVGAAAMASTSI